MHVTACILLLPLRPLHHLPSSSYMYVHVHISCICMYMRYMLVLCSYMHVFPAITPQDTGNDATSPNHCLQGQQSAGHTQGIPGHLGIHFFSSWQMLLWPDLAHPTRCTRLGPLKRPCHWPLGGLQCTNRALQSSLVTCHIRSGRLKPIQTPQGAGHRPSKTQPYCNSSMSVYVCICMYMYIHTVYACIHMYKLSHCHVYVCIYDLAYVDVSICLYMYVYACICVYARIYIRKGHIC